MQVLRYITVLAASASAAYTDCKYYKIKNNITVPTALIGLFLAAADKKFMFADALLGLILPFIICLFFYTAKMLKAGDVKLFMCLGAVMGWKWILNCMAASIIAGGAAALIICIKQKILKERFIKLFDYFRNIFCSRTFFCYAEAESGKFPLGVSIFIGTAAVIILERFGFYLFF